MQKRFAFGLARVLSEDLKATILIIDEGGLL